MLHVLVVEDLQVDRLILKKELSPHFQVTTLSSAIEAKAFSHTHHFDIALLNVMLQNDLDCIDLLSDLNKIAVNRFLPIAITCHLDEDRHSKVLDAGFAAVMQKPFNLKKFINLLP